MLILYRKKGEAIRIGEDITISIVESSTDGVRIAIDAPKDVPIMRKELVEAVQANREAAVSDAVKNKEALKQMNAMLKKK